MLMRERVKYEIILETCQYRPFSGVDFSLSYNMYKCSPDSENKRRRTGFIKDSRQIPAEVSTPATDGPMAKRKTGKIKEEEGLLAGNSTKG
jgi:hypothetical protein